MNVRPAGQILLAALLALQLWSILEPEINRISLPRGSFFEQDGRLRVDCDRVEVLCDDEEA